MAARAAHRVGMETTASARPDPLQRIEALARAVKPGPWTGLGTTEADKAFIVAMSPEVALDLVAQVRDLQLLVQRWRAFAMLQKAEADMFEAELSQARAGGFGLEPAPESK